MLKRLLILIAALLGSHAPALSQSRVEIERTMKRATTFMVEKVATNGGYVWSYLPDFSRRWGEIEAKPSMIWVQPPGTATMGHLFLDAYHATGDEYYYGAAEKAAGALIWGQHRSGGWNYFIDFAGPSSTKHWYETIGRNAWRMEEFQHYADNATFDDMGTSEAAQFLLRLYLEKRDPRYRPGLERAVDFVLDSQYPIGGWPQRWPYDPSYPEYQKYITFNDDVAAENVKFLVMVYQSLGDTRALDAIHRGMNIYLLTQQGPPQPGWALQYTLDLKPAAARSYEPNALHTATTAGNVEQLMNFYRMTGDSRFLARIPEALAWLESVRLPEPRGGRGFPTFIEIGTNRPIYVHRRGSNVVNGQYYWDYSAEATLGHYSAFRNIDVAKLRRSYDELLKIPAADLAKASPLQAPDPRPLPRYFVSGGMTGSDLNAGSPAASVRDLIRSLNPEGWWPTPLNATSNPYRGDGPAEPVPGDFRTTHVGDASDTSPYTTDAPVTGISTSAYIANMARLIRQLTGEQ
ncbi:MAG: pectate lyase [Pseudomonadota bacterium]|nr:pectate lyase [Pseudomonadota bacterium]